MSVQAKEGEQFSHWIVNGEKIDTATFEVSADMINVGALEVECVCVPDPNADLCISAVKAKGVYKKDMTTGIFREVIEE